MQTTLRFPFFKRDQARISLTDEPFRLFFPSGIAAAFLGVALWPISIWGMLGYYPGPAHARLMIGGFFGAMILGFLGTAGPRMLSVRRLSRVELGMLFGLWFAGVLAGLGNRLALADGVTCATFLLGFCIAASRVRGRKDLPPPGFAMVLLGLVSGFFGSVLNFLISIGWSGLPAPYVCSALGKLLFYQAFILLPILGIAPFFFPRFGGLPNPQTSYPEFRRPSWDWMRRALIAGAFGMAVLGSFVWEAFGWPRAAGLLRVAMVVGYVWWQVPLRFPRGSSGTLGKIVQVSTILLAVGMLLAAAYPAYRIGLLHLVYIGGFNFIALAVANWVIFGHSGMAGKGRSPLVYARWAAGLIVFALATRLSADFFPEVRQSHLAYAAVLWMAGMAVWAWRILPRARVADEE